MTSLPATNPKPKGYTAEEVDRGLTEVALCAGNTNEAAKRLKERGFRANGNTLRSWKNRDHPERYQEICAELIPKIHAKIASEQEEIAHTASQLELQLLADLENKREGIPLKELPTALRNVSVTKGVAMDKLLPMRDRPTAIVEHRHAEDLLKELEGVFPRRFDADSTAEELTEEG